jgi:hypothetical protein
MNSISPKLSLRIVLPVLFLYASIVALGLHFHELFLDEAHHFLLARDSDSLASMYNNARYDGHPRLWHALLFFITHVITTDPVAMQVFHWLITTAVAYVFLRYAPFDLSIKILVLAGYYFLFEYSLLSRNYALGILLLFICCHLLNDKEKNLVGVGALLVVMCNTHIFFTFAAMGIFLILFIDRVRQRKLFSRRFILFTGLFLIGFASALIQARTPAGDNVNMTAVRPAEWLSVKNISFAAYSLIRGWLPVPRINGGHFWNSYWLTKDIVGSLLPYLLFLVLLTFPALLLRKKVEAMLFYYTGLFLLLVFFVVTQLIASRYFGMVFIFFLAAAWMTADGSGTVFSFPTIPGPPVVRVFFRSCLYGILIIQVLVGGYAFEQDLTRPFSQSKNTVDYLKGLRPGRQIVVDGYNAGPMLCAYLQGKVFYLATGAEGSFCIWRRAYFPIPRPSISQEIAQTPRLRNFGEFILVSNRELWTDSVRSAAGNYRLSELQCFENSIVGENYYIYQVAPF